MKFLIIIMALTFSFSARSNEITEVNREGVLERAKVKSLNVYFGLGQIKDLGLNTQFLATYNCEVWNSKNGEIICHVADNDEDHGWTEGVLIHWDVEHAGESNEVFRFEKIVKIEH